MFIVGASTLGRIVVDIARSAGITISGFVDDVCKESPFGDIKLAGNTAWLLAQARAGTALDTFVAVGDNQHRLEMFARLKEAGLGLPSVVDPRAAVAPGVQVGAGNLVMAHAYLGAGVSLGDANILFPGACLNHDITVGNGNFFAPGVSVGGRTCIANLCKFGMNSALNHDLDVPAGFSCRPCAFVEKL